MRKAGMVLVAGLLVAIAMFAAPVGAQSITAKSRLLGVSDLPTGWSVDATPNTPLAGCFSPIFRGGGIKTATVAFVMNGGAPSLDEVVTVSKSPTKLFGSTTHRLVGCTSFTHVGQGQTIKATVGPLSLPTVGTQSKAFTIAFTTSGLHVFEDVVIFRTGAALGAVVLGNVGSVDSSQLMQLAGAAVARAGASFPGGPATTTTAPKATTTVPPATAPTTAPTTTAPPAPTTTVTAGCTPLTNGGNCYQPGEYCRASDHGATGRAGNGEAIVCQDNDGWRWEPA